MRIGLCLCLAATACLSARITQESQCQAFIENGRYLIYVAEDPIDQNNGRYLGRHFR